MNILGIFGGYYNSAACLLGSGRLLAFIEEEKVSRNKDEKGFPVKAVKYCLKCSGLKLSDINYIAFPWQPLKNLTTLPLIAVKEMIKRFFSSGAKTTPSSKLPAGFHDLLVLLQGAESQTRHMISAGLRYNGIDGRIPPIVFTGHHLSHAASVFYASGFDRSLIYVTDGMGDDLSTSLWIGEGKSLRSIKKFYFPNSLGEFYAAFTEFLGFEPYSHEGKLMGLAAYGEKDDEIIEKIKKHIISYHNGKYQVNSLYTVNGAHDYGERFTNLLVDLFGSPRLPEAKIETFHFNLAHAAQALLEQASENVLGYYMKKTGIKDVCISGGVGMNCKMNGHLLHALPIEKIFINPASNDAGSAMGAALALSMQKGVDPRFTMTHACFGPGFSSVQVEAVLKEARVKYRKSKNIPEDAAKALAQGKIIGWHQGRQEAGARALGSRSILASPLSKSMIDKINKNVKHREPWRPFAPSLLAECAGDYYSLGKMSPFMILAFTVNKDKRRIIPAVTHIDNTCRPQTVTRSDNPRYYDLIRAFEKKTGVPVILNTSFNVRGEPIVSTPADSLRCFFATGIEQLFIEDFIVEK